MTVYRDCRIVGLHKICKLLLHYIERIDGCIKEYFCCGYSSADLLTSKLFNNYHFMDYNAMHFCIRESVDSLCRDGADTPIVRVHWKAFLTREYSRFKPFSAREWPIQPLLYPMIPHK